MMHTGFSNLDGFLNKYDKFVISTHESPDWDGLGSELGFHELLGLLGKKSIIINSDPPPATYSSMDPAGVLNVMDGDFRMPEDIGEHAHVVLDTNDYENIGAVYYALKGKLRDLFIIDHHEGGDEKFDTNFIKAGASSASELIYEIFQYYKKPISSGTALALMAGIVFDTGSFRYSKTSPDTFRAAAHLVELGASPVAVNEIIYENNTLESFTLRSMIQSSMKTLCDGKLATLMLTPDMLEKSGASFAEGEPSINLPLAVRGVQASIMVKQDLNGPVKVSMRTKGNLDVAEIAIKNGGGGHKNAAGYKSPLSFEETYRKAVSEMEKFFK